MSEGFPVMPGQEWSLEGIYGAEVDAVYTGAAGERVEQNVAMPYTTTPREGETHVQFIIRVRDIPGEFHYLDGDE